MGRGGPVLTMERIAFDNSGKAIEFGHHCYRPDMYSFEDHARREAAAPQSGCRQ
jgi:DNA-binding GntR family transcriptional regulator